MIDAAEPSNVNCGWEAWVRSGLAATNVISTPSWVVEVTFVATAARSRSYPAAVDARRASTIHLRAALGVESVIQSCATWWRRRSRSSAKRMLS